MSRSAKNENAGNYYFGYHSNPGTSYRPMSASAGRSRTPQYRSNSNSSNPSTPNNNNINNNSGNGPSVQVFTDINKMNAHLYSASSSSNPQRPSSAGSSRPVAPNHHLTPTEILYQTLHGNNSNNNPTTLPSTQQQQQQQSSNPMGPSANFGIFPDQQYRQVYQNRPKSAGATRRPPSDSNPYLQYQQQVQLQQQQQQQANAMQGQDINVKVPILTNKYNVSTPTGPTVANVKPSPVIFTINNSNNGNNNISTSSTTSNGLTHSNGTKSAPIIQTSTSNSMDANGGYKAHYNYPNNVVTNGPQGHPIGATTTLMPVTTSGPHPLHQIDNDNNATSFAATLSPLSAYAQVRPSSATSATTKIRQAISDSHKFTPTNIANPSNPSQQRTFTYQSSNGTPLSSSNNHKTGQEDDGDVTGDLNGERKMLDNDDDDNDMDGKPISFSRSHPEVSLTTPSNSLELGNGGISIVGGMLDIRNSSVDSLQDEDIDVGLSTLPNQFCTKRDATELKKLLLMGNNDIGGIVPSSSALMDIYMVGKVIGVGSYGKVRVAWHRLTGAKVAIKTYDKSKMKDQAHWKRVYSEIKIMEQVSHPRISRLYEAVETPKRMHLIMECLDGGNLCSYVKQKKRLSEDESRRIFFQILQAVDYLHSYGITHRDIKLENVLFSGNGQGSSGSEIKLIDFGFSTVCQPGKRLKVFCGTPSYMAPEIVRRLEYEGRAVDMWSLGILLYALLCGCFPFRAKTYPDLYRRIARGTFLMPDELSTSVKDLLKNLLHVDPAERLTSHAALRHVWLQMQFSTAQDLNKLRREIPILISDKPSDDIDEQVLCEMEKYGILRDDIIRAILTKTHTAIATLYYLLLDNILSKRKLAGISSNPNSHINQGANPSKNITRSSSAHGHRIKQQLNPNGNNAYIMNPKIITNPTTSQTNPSNPSPMMNQTMQYNNTTGYQSNQVHPNIQQHIVLPTNNVIRIGHGIDNTMSGPSSSSTGQAQRPRSASAARTSSSSASSSNQKPLISFVGQR